MPLNYCKWGDTWGGQPITQLMQPYKVDLEEGDYINKVGNIFLAFIHG